MSQESNVIYEFGRFRLDPASNRLTRDGMPLQPPSKTVDILKVLVQNAGEVVTAELITKEVWPHALPGQEDVNSHIARLRKVLEDSHEESRYVRSIAGQGFRFVEPVSELLATSCDDEIGRAVPTVSEHRTPGKSNARLARILAAFAAAVLLAVLGIWAGYFRHSGPPKPQIKIAILPLSSLGASSVGQSNQAFTAALIAQLGKSQKLTATDEVQKYKAGASDPAAAGRALGVNAVITGLIQRAGSDFQMNLQVIDAKDGSQIWAGSFDGESSDISALGDTISAALSKHFQLSDDSADQQ